MRKIFSKAFTLVELIVVVTILSILSTIWFVSYSSYLSWVRDTNRISQLKAIWDSLHLYETKKSLPLPDEKRLEIKDWATTIAIQWYVWKSVIETIWYTSEGKDPKDNTYFSYYLTKNRKYFQLLAYLEEEPSTMLSSKLLLTTKAIDYENRYPYVYWRKLWILTTDKNEPIQETETWSLNIMNVWTTKTYKSYLKTKEIITWSWELFKDLWKISKVWWRWWSEDSNKFVYNDLDWEKISVNNQGSEDWWNDPNLDITWNEKSCKEIIDKWFSSQSGLYYINPTWSSKFKVYCDMSTDWGWWTLLITQREWSYFTSSNVSNYTSQWVGLVSKYSILWKSTLFKRSWFYEFMYKDNTNWGNRRVTVRQSNNISSSSPSSCSILKYNVSAPNSSYFNCFYRMSWTSSYYNVYWSYSSNWTFWIWAIKSRSPAWLVTWNWSDWLHYVNAWSTYYSFWVR